MFQIQGDAYFRTDLKRLAHKILVLKSNFNFSWSVKNLLGVLLLFKISRNLVESKKRLANLYFLNKNQFS